MWTLVLEVLQNVHEDGASNVNRGIMTSFIGSGEVFVCVCNALDEALVGITNELSIALQQKYENIIQAMHSIKAVRALLQDFREMGCEKLLVKISLFCEGNLNPMPNIYRGQYENPLLF